MGTIEYTAESENCQKLDRSWKTCMLGLFFLAGCKYELYICLIPANTIYLFRALVFN